MRLYVGLNDADSQQQPFSREPLINLRNFHISFLFGLFCLRDNLFGLSYGIYTTVIQRPVLQHLSQSFDDSRRQAPTPSTGLLDTHRIGYHLLNGQTYSKDPQRKEPARNRLSQQNKE